MYKNVQHTLTNFFSIETPDIKEYNINKQM